MVTKKTELKKTQTKTKATQKTTTHKHIIKQQKTKTNN